MPRIIGDNIDRLVTVEMRTQGIVRGNIVQLYDAARAKQCEPLAMLAAQRLRDAIHPGDTIIIATGAGSWPWLPKGETDGPPGAASLARALSLGLGARPIIVSEERNLPGIIAASAAIGLLNVDARTLAARTGAVLTTGFGVDDATATAQAVELMDRWKPRAVIAIEKLGPNAKGEIHSLQGFNCTEDTARIHHLFDLAAQRGVLTIGYADGGNEIGCGVIYDETRKIMPAGAVCQCPCGDGMATVVSTDVLVVATTSNWGAYGTTACLAFLLGDASLLQDAAVERRMVEQCALAGAGDGMSGMAIPWVDGSNLEVQQAMVTILQMIVSNGLRTVKRPF
jgi:hypothetical protein